MNARGCATGRWLLGFVAALSAACATPQATVPPGAIIVGVRTGPNNLDPRIGTDAQSERIDELLFDSLVKKDEHFNLQPWVAEKWEIADPLPHINS